MLQRIARKLAGGCDQFGLVHQGKLHLRGPLPHLLPRHHYITRSGDGYGLLLARFHPPISEWKSPLSSYRSSIPVSTFNAVRTPASDMPSSTRVMATAGCMPTTTVSASSTRAMAAMLASILPMKESTISSVDISIKTPLELHSEIFSVRSS